MIWGYFLHGWFKEQFQNHSRVPEQVYSNRQVSERILKINKRFQSSK
jgi:hypothetical protein